MRRFLAIAAMLSCLAMSSARALEPFTTDGCSLFPDRLPGIAPYCECCVLHDLAYWRGGTKEERLSADQAFRACIARATGDDLLAQSMYEGVRGGGSPYYRTPFRWGYGWPYGRNYRPLSASEREKAEALEREYRASHPVLMCP